MKRTSRSTILTGRMTASKPTKTGTTLLAAAPQSAKEPAIVCVIAYQKGQGLAVQDANLRRHTPIRYGATYSSQKDVYDHLGVTMLENAWQGFNCTMFA